MKILIHNINTSFDNMKIYHEKHESPYDNTFNEKPKYSNTENVFLSVKEEFQIFNFNFQIISSKVYI